MKLFGWEFHRAEKDPRKSKSDKYNEALRDWKYSLKENNWRYRVARFLRVPKTVLWTSDQKKPASATGQTRDYMDSQYSSAFNAHQSLKFNMGFYDALRETIPILDVAVTKLVRLIGAFELTADNKSDLEFLNKFKRQVKVNHFERGFLTLLNQVTDSALAKGMGFFELVPTASMSDVYRLKVARANDFRFLKQDDKLVLAQRMPSNDFKLIPFENQDYIYYLAFDRRDGHPQGYSLFHSLPFVSQIMVRILNALDNQMWRIGDPSFIFTIEKAGTGSDYANASEAIALLQTHVSTAMRDRKQGKPRDIFAALPADSVLKIQTIGNEKDVIDTSVTMRTVLEQIVAKTNLPPFMFGLSWSTTERLSSHQNDMIISMIESYRQDWDPLIDKVFNSFIALNGRAGMKWGFQWNPVNLMDEVEMAKARLLNAQSAEKEIYNLTTLVSLGWLRVDDAILSLMENGIISKKIIDRLGKEEALNRLHQLTRENKAADILARILAAHNARSKVRREDLDDLRDLLFDLRN